MVRIDENSRRRAGIALEHSIPIVLGDSQKWYFPKPWLEIQPNFHDGKVVQVKSVLTHGKQIEDLLNSIHKSVDDCSTISAIAALGAYLLLWNYQLSDDELSELFCFRLGDEQSEAWTTHVIDLAIGQSGPKALSGGNV